MKNANWTRILTILLSLLALYALLAVLAGIIQRFIVPLLLIILAAILAFILTPVVRFIQNRLHVFRWLSILMTYLLVAAILGSLGFFLTSPLIAQTRSLADAIKNPTHLENVLRVRDASSRLLNTAIAYNTALAGGAGSPPCTAEQYLVQNAAVSRGAGCASVPQGPRMAPLLKTFTGYLRGLQNTSLKPATNHAVQHHPSSAPIATTRVPASWIKPTRADVSRLQSALNRALIGVSATGAAHYTSDAASLVNDSKQLSKDVEHLYVLVKTTPIIIIALQNQIDQHHWPVNVRSLLGNAVGNLSSQGANVLNNAVTILTGTINVIFDLFIIIIMSFYLLADGGRFIGWIMGLVPERHRDQAWFFIKSLDEVLGGYIRGQVIVAITIGILAGAGSYALGIPYALLIGIFAFLAESIPVIGPVLASIPAILVSLLTQSLVKTALVVGWFILVQQIEQNIVGPRITGHAVGIHPVVAMVAIIIGLEVGGFWGAFLAVPVTGLLQILIRTGYSYLILRKPLPTAEMPETLDLAEETAHAPNAPPRPASP